MADECKGCEKLEVSISKLEAKLEASQTDLEKALDDLAAATTAKDEAVKKTNRLATEVDRLQKAAGTGSSSGGGSSSGNDSQSDKRSVLQKVIGWPW